MILLILLVYMKIKWSDFPHKATQAQLLYGVCHVYDQMIFTEGGSDDDICSSYSN